MKYILIVLFFLSFNLYSQEYLINLNAKVVSNETHKYSQSSYFNILKLDGPFTDNLGNYGSWNALVSVEVFNNKIKQHFFSAKIVYQDDSVVFAQGSRTSEEFEQGVGKFQFTVGPKKLKSLINTSCIYGLKFHKKSIFTSAKCNISNESLIELTSLDDS